MALIQHLTIRPLSPADKQSPYAHTLYMLLQQIPNGENGFKNEAYALPFSQFQQWILWQYQLSTGECLLDNGLRQSTYWFFMDHTPVGFGKFRHAPTNTLSLPISAQVAGGNIGYGLAIPYRGRGLAAPFVSKLIDEMERAGLTEVYFTIQKQNQASIRVAERCGARPIGSSESRLFYSRSLNVFGASR